MAAQLEQSFEQFIPPNIENKTEQLASALQSSVKNSDITAAVATTTDILTEAKKGVSV